MAQFHHSRAPFIMPTPADAIQTQFDLWAEAVVRRELKQYLRRAGIPFNADDSTIVLGALQEAAHQLRSNS
jgi:hypothetical protein